MPKLIDAADIRMVTLFKGELFHGAEVLLMHKDDVDKFVEAQENLHRYPNNYNPHSRHNTSPLSYLKVEKLDPGRNSRYWWTNPTLRDDAIAGAVVLGWETVLEKHYNTGPEPTATDDIPNPTFVVG